MALPTEFNTINVVQDYVDLLGAPGTGNVTFTLSTTPAVLKALNSKVLIVGAPIVGTLTAGHMSVTLPFTNDPDILPSVPYNVVETVSGSRRQFTIDVPVGLGSGPVYLSDLAPVGTPASGTNYLTRGQGDALYAPIGTTGGGGTGGLDAEAVMDHLGTVGLVEGTGIDITYNDPSGTITIAATTASDTINYFRHTDGSWTPDPATALPAAIKVRWFNGTAAYTGTTLSGVLDRFYPTVTDLP